MWLLRSDPRYNYRSQGDDDVNDNDVDDLDQVLDNRTVSLL